MVLQDTMFLFLYMNIVLQLFSICNANFGTLKYIDVLSFYKNTQKNSSSKKRNRTVESTVRFSLSEDFLIRYYSASIPHCCLARRL